MNTQNFKKMKAAAQQYINESKEFIHQLDSYVDLMNEDALTKDHYKEIQAIVSASSESERDYKKTLHVLNPEMNYQVHLDHSAPDEESAVKVIFVNDGKLTEKQQKQMTELVVEMVEIDNQWMERMIPLTTSVAKFALKLNEEKFGKSMAKANRSMKFADTMFAILSVVMLAYFMTAFYFLITTGSI